MCLMKLNDEATQGSLMISFCDVSQTLMSARQVRLSVHMAAGTPEAPSFVCVTLDTRWEPTARNATVSFTPRHHTPETLN